MRTVRGWRNTAHLCLLGAVLMQTGVARADPVDIAALPDIADTNWAMDLYQGSALGSVRIIGMGGAQVAIAEGAAGMSANPASPAVRPSTSNDKWDWDWYLDWLNPDLASDFDGNGIYTEEKSEDFPVLSLGLVGQYKKWAVGVTATAVKNPVVVGSGMESVEAQFSVGTFSVARTFRDDRITAGLGVRFGSFAMHSTDVSTGTTSRLFNLNGSGLEAGVVWRPHWRDIRVGGTLSLPITGVQLDPNGCDPMNCNGFILPGEVRVPWRLAVGFGYRRAGTRWNRQVYEHYRDEKSLMVSADVVFTGATENGFGLEAFAKQKLQRSGEDVVMSVRVGTEYEWKPGRVRLRGGSYYEPGRFTGVDGRLHVTGGADVRVWSFHLWGKNRRVRLSATGDFAHKYINAGASLGLWH